MVPPLVVRYRGPLSHLPPVKGKDQPSITYSFPIVLADDVISSPSPDS